MAIGDKREMYVMNTLQCLNERLAFAFIILSYNDNIDDSSSYTITGSRDHSNNTFAQVNDAISLTKYPVL